MNGIRENKTMVVTYGESVTANAFSTEFNLTEDKEYIVVGFDGDCIQVENDLGIKDWYSPDYFREFAGMHY